MRVASLVLLLGLIFTGLSAYAVEAYEFNDPVKEERFQHLSQELRCLVCQNQNLADSNAELAQDLRAELHRMIQSGASDQEIVDFMVQRYGDFVLYRPPFKATTVLLWVGPFLLAALALIIVVRYIRRESTQTTAALTDEEQRRLQSILEQHRKES